MLVNKTFSQTVLKLNDEKRFFKLRFFCLYALSKLEIELKGKNGEFETNNESLRDFKKKRFDIPYCKNHEAYIRTFLSKSIPLK